jgi:hypothetical protein
MHPAINARILLALLCLFALATSAHAECAWVLWWSQSDGRRSVALAQPTVRGYIKELDDRAQPFGDPKLEEGQMRHRMSPTEPLRLWRTKSDWQTTFVCLPDTVDPRGRKGK